ncbi:MAG: Ig-like domain-containing protein [Eubacterium sp.]
MRKQFFYNNNQTQSKKIRKNLKKEWTKVVCIGTLSATVLTGIPVIPVANTYAQEACVALEENRATYNLADPSLLTEKTIKDFKGEEHQTDGIIDIAITEDGTYTIKGSNVINGAYVDVHISIADGVKANVIFDNVEIKNDDKYLLDIDGCSDCSEPLFPFMDIYGTANVYLKGTNSITMPQKNTYDSPKVTVFRLYGQLSIKEDTETPGSSLQVNCAQCLINADSSDGGTDGIFTMEGGTVEASNASIQNVDQLYMMGGNLTCGDIEKNNLNTYYYLGGEVKNNYFNTWGGMTIVTGVKLSDNIYIENAKDDCGYDVEKMTVTDLPISKKVSAINGYPTDSLKTTEGGELEAYLRKGNNVIEVEGVSYPYKWDDVNQKLNFQSDVDLCNVEFVVSEGGVEKAYRNVKVEKGTKIGSLFDDNKYTYTYKKEDGTGFDANTVINSDMKVLMTPSVRQYDVTIDGETESMSSLPTGKIYLGANNCCYYGGSPVTKELVLQSIDTMTENGVEYVKISSKNDLNMFSKLACADDHINGVLVADIDMEQSQLESTIKIYKGIFEGNGHTIRNIKGDSDVVGGLCRKLLGTVRDVCFENVSFPNEGAYCSSGAMGAICSINRGTIQNCKVTGSQFKIIESDGDTYEGETNLYRPFPVGSVAGVNMGLIQNCFVAQNQFDDSEISSLYDRSKIVYPIAGNFGKIENCYYKADADQESETSDERAGIGIVDEKIVSGEACYLLNNKVSDGTQKWYQKLSGEDADHYPTLKKEVGNTVYKGYDQCEVAYTNTADTQLAHSFTYAATSDNVITATCGKNSAHTATETLVAANAVYDKAPHAATVEYSDSWEELGLSKSTTIQYMRDGVATTNLVSAGTITAVIKQGDDVQATKQYTISKAEIPQKAPNVTTSVPFTQKTITEDMFGADNNWKPSSEFVGTEIPETGSVNINVIYVGDDADNYNKTTIQVDVQRSVCTHNLDKVAAIAATEEAEGNKEYYKCNDCGKYFEDALGTKEITKESVVIPKLEPTPTAAPTATPTAVPTAAPTAAPTATPIAVPTAVPTATPTAAPTAAPTAVPTATSTATPTAAPTATPTVTPMTTETPVPSAPPAPVITPKKVSAPQVMMELIQPIISKTLTQKLSWSKVKGADGYFIYASKCSKGGNIRKLKLVCTISSSGKTSYVNKKLQKQTWYKYEIQAYRIINGKKVAFGRSLQLHALTKGGKKYANPTRVRIIGSDKLTLKVGATDKVKAKVVLPKGKKCQWHINKIRYCVSDPNIITVSNKGKITAKSAGKATIYAVAQNGKMAKVSVEVTK